MPNSPKFSHEMSAVFPVAVEFHALAVELATEPGFHFLRNPLERAAVRVVVALAEAPESPRDPSAHRFHRAAAAAVRKCSALLLTMAARKIVTGEVHARARELLLNLEELMKRHFAAEGSPAAKPRASRPRPATAAGPRPHDSAGDSEEGQEPTLPAGSPPGNSSGDGAT